MSTKGTKGTKWLVTFISTYKKPKIKIKVWVSQFQKIIPLQHCHENCLKKFLTTVVNIPLYPSRDVFNIACFKEVVLFLSLYSFMSTKETKGKKWLATFISTYEKPNIKIKVWVSQFKKIIPLQHCHENCLKKFLTTVVNIPLYPSRVVFNIAFFNEVVLFFSLYSFYVYERNERNQMVGHSHIDLRKTKN